MKWGAARNKDFDNMEGIKYEPLRSGCIRFNEKKTPPKKTEKAGDIENDHETKSDTKKPPKSDAKSWVQEMPPTYK